MKKIKQFANHAFVRPGDRTEVLSEQLLEAEKRIDQIKLTVESTARKVHACIHRKDKDKDNKDREYADPFEKRIKKLPEILLGNAMIADSKQLGDDSVLGDVLGESGQIEIKLGQEAVKFEMKIENEVLKPLQKFMKMFSDINKLREKLTKYTSDMDSAKARLQQAVRHSQSGGQAGKIDSFKEELEEAQQKVEQYRDNLATEMYSVIAKESEISRCILNFLTYQKEYHHSVYSILKELIPNAESSIAKSIHKPVYGVKLDDHLDTTGRSIAYPIELCVCGLLETALEEEGLFRMAGSASKVKKLKSAFDAGLVDLTGLLGEFSDAHVIANALKSYLRELKEPLLTFDLYKEWMNAIRLNDNDEKLKAIWTVVQKLPKPNFENLQYLVKFLKELSNHQDLNKMSTANIAIVIAPNLLWDNPEGSGGSAGGADPMVGDSSNQMGLNMTMTHHYSSVLDQLITYADYFFPDEIDFFVTCEKPKEHEKAALLTNGGLPSSVTEECSNSEAEGGSQMKRSHSNSSVDEQGNTGPPSPHGSPKPVLRRKNKPAPVPPTAPSVNKNPLAHFSATANSPSSPNSPSGGGDMVQRSSSSSGTTSKNSNTQSKYPSAGAPIPFSPKNSFDMGLSMVGKKSNEKRDAMWIPPSPRETVRKNVITAENNSTSIMGPPPAKPPPPSIESLSKTGNVVAGGEVQSQKPTLPPASPLRHKSSFKSSNSVENNLSISSSPTATPTGQSSKNSTTDNLNPRGSVGSCQSPSAFSSLPRHFHTENSYKNAGGRPSRPPSMWGVPPPAVPPPAPPVTTTSNSQQSATQSPVSLPPVPITVPTEVKESEELAPASLHLGFERIEATVRKDSLPTSVNEDKTADSPVKETVDRPIPAPRSSLLSQSSASNIVSTGVVPVVRERPSLMAKPRDLTKRNLHGHQQQQSSGSVSDRPLNVGSSGNRGGKDVSNFRVADYEKRHSRSSSGGGQSDVADSDSPQEFSKDYDNSGAVDEISGDSQSGKGKPPRPQPPAPPKVRVSQAESTDL